MKKTLTSVLLLILSAPLLWAGTQGKTTTYTAFAVFPPGAPERMPIPFRITINAASSQSRVAKFVKAVDSGKNAAIEEVLRSSTDGLLTPVGRAGFKLGLVLIQEVETGQLIVGITDRPIWPFPNMTQLQVHGYEFGVVYLRLDKNGSGTGDMVPFSKILPDPRNGFKVERKIEETIRLNSVQLSSDEMKDEKR